MFAATILAICINLYFLASLMSVAGIGMLTFALLILFLADCYHKKSDFKIKDLRIPGDILLGLFVLITFISLAVNYYQGIPLRESFIDLRWVLSVYVIAWAMKKYLTIEKKLHPISIFVIILSLYNIAQFFWGFDFKGTYSFTPGVDPYSQGAVWRARGLLSNPIRLANVFGAFGILMLPLALKQIAQRKRFIFILAFAGCFISLILSLTRGAWLAFFIAVPFILYFYNRKLIMYFFVSIVIIATTLFYISPDFQSRVTTLIQTKTLETEGRVVIWKVHYRAFLNNFWFGSGAGTSGSEAAKFATEHELSVQPIRSHAHNEILDILVTRGIFGGLIFVLFNIFYIRLGIKSFKSLNAMSFKKELSLGAAGGLFFLFLAGLTEANIESSDISNMMVLCLSVIVWLSKEQLKEKIIV